MASTHSGIPDTNRTLGTMRPFLKNRAGRATGAIAPPATPPRPTDAASLPSETIPTRSPAPVSAPDHPITVYLVSRQPKLLDRLAEALRARHYSPRTEQSYRHWVKRFIFFHNVRHPAEMAEPEINAFLTHLAVQEKVSASTQTQALSALLFLYRHVLGREIGALEGLIHARKSRHLPVVMTREEVKGVLAISQGTNGSWQACCIEPGCGCWSAFACGSKTWISRRIRSRCETGKGRKTA